MDGFGVWTVLQSTQHWKAVKLSKKKQRGVEICNMYIYIYNRRYREYFIDYILKHQKSVSIFGQLIATKLQTEYLHPNTMKLNETSKRLGWSGNLSKISHKNQELWENSINFSNKNQVLAPLKLPKWRHVQPFSMFPRSSTALGRRHHNKLQEDNHPVHQFQPSVKNHAWPQCRNV